MSTSLLISRYKVRQFFGPVLKSKKALLGIVLLFILMLPSGFGFALIISQVTPGAQFLETTSAVVSAFLSLVMILSFLGGMMVHQSEIDFLMPTNLRPRAYMLGDLGFQLFTWSAMSILFILPFLLFSVVLLRVTWSAALALFLLYLGLILFASALSQSLGVFVMLGGRRRLVLPAALLLLLNLPALQFLTSFPIRYSNLPLPSTAFAGLGLSLLFDFPLDPSWPIILMAYTAVLAAFYWNVSRGYFFPQVRPTMMVGFGASPFQTAPVQQERMIRGLSRLTTKVQLSPEGSFGGYMTRYHLVRLLRDGSLLGVFLLVVVFLVIGSQFPSGDEVAAAATVGTMTYLSLIAIVIMGINWITTERENTWVLLVSQRGTGPYFRGVLLAFWAVGGVIVVLGTLLLFAVGSGFDAMGFLAAEAGFISGSSTMVVLLQVWRIPSGGFTLRMMLLFAIPGMAAVLGFLPVLGMAILPLGNGLGILSISVAVLYVLTLCGIFLIGVGRASRRFSLEIPAPM